MNRCRIFTDADYKLLLTQPFNNRGVMPTSKWLWRIIFRLAACCGLRTIEIRRLRIQDVILDSKPQHLLVFGKRDKKRSVWMHWDKPALDDIADWYKFRINQGAQPTDPFVCNQGSDHRFGWPLHQRSLFDMFRRFCKPLGRPCSPHDGRHSAATHALAKGKSLPAVRDWLGHADIRMTSRYLHILDDLENGKDLWGVRGSAVQSESSS